MSDRFVEILLVEDNPNDVDLTLRAFKKNDLSNPIHVARDGAAALDFLFGGGKAAASKVENVPKLVLLDLKLPKVDGLQILRRIKADPRTHLIPVVALTSSRDDRDVVEAYKLGVNSYIVKPVDFERFVEEARQLGMYWLMLNESPSDLSTSA